MWLFFGLPVIAVFVMCVIHASETLDKIRMHWNEYRCNPIYIPFAGMIRPDIGVESNFQHCMNMFGQDIFKFFVDAIHSMMGDLTSGLSEFTSTLGPMRSVFSKMRKVIFSFGAQTFGKIINSMSNLTFIIIKIRDILKRFVGQGYIGAFLAQTGMDFIVSMVMLLVSIIKTFVYALLAISIILALFQPEMLVLAVILASLLGASGF
jgi:hypothetical protein